MSRPKYKELWLEQYAYAEGLKDALDEMKRELLRLQRVLSDEGQMIVEKFPDGDGPVNLTPIDFECVTALIRRHAIPLIPYTSHGIQNYSWRGRPLRRE